ncbi:MAG TPA: TetR/AcrR family transcriptional regulator [Polyangiaceae bacterium]
MPPPTRPAPRKLPTQERSRALYAALLTASAELLERDGPEFTLADVAARAGVSPGSLYQYFPDRAALVAALIDWQVDCDRARLEAWKHALRVPDTDIAAELARALIAFYADRPALLSHLVKLLAELGRQGDVQALIVELCADLAQLLRTRAPERALAECREASNAAVFGALSIVRQAAQENPEKLGEPEFCVRLTAVVRAALG